MPLMGVAANLKYKPEGRFVGRHGQWLYEIAHVDAMPPFLMTCVGDTDLWLFLSSTGAFTAGRVEADRCLFPYENDDCLHALAGRTGPITLVRFEDGRIWRPLHGRPDAGEISRVLRRSLCGDRVEFEETDEQSGLTFRVKLGLSDRFGVVRECELRAPARGSTIECELLDGYVNVMPAGVPLGMQQAMSTLVDGYKRTERIDRNGPVIYALESTITDRPAAIESLRANAIWHLGLENSTLCLSTDAIDTFERGESPRGDDLILGRRGAYLCSAKLWLNPGMHEGWCVVGDVHLDHGDIAALARKIRTGTGLLNEIEKSLAHDRERLARLLDGADASQVTADIGACAAHRANVLFNAKRGGVPLDDYTIDRDAFRRFVHDRHASIGARHDEFLTRLDHPLILPTLLDTARAEGSHQLVRLALEYLPLTFGRRHGDPSRPWNRFRIQVRDDTGNRITGYEGNWRDIFQNWEAMCRSYPALLPGVISKFVNASTVDGHNPYRINEHGIDWEVPEPDNGWTTIGYWGDHQIVYLLRLLEQCHHTLPDWLLAMLEEPVFSYANIPYRLRPFKEIAANPRSTIEFDFELNDRITSLTEEMGDDGRLVLNDEGEPVLVTLLEKLLVPALAKISSLVPGGGVWLNTQRPEWNDANNALAGYGLSVVTTCYLRRYCKFVAELIEVLGPGQTALSPAVAAWCEDVVTAISRILDEIRGEGNVDDGGRWEAMVELGAAAEKARSSLYARGPEASVPCERETVLKFFQSAQELCEHSIRCGQRPDGLFDSYNILSLGDSHAAVDRLELMLEGQVAALSSGMLSAEEACSLLDALFQSELYRSDQRSFMLYPRKGLPRFMDRNVIPSDAMENCRLLQQAAERGEMGIVARDIEGSVRFCADINSHQALDKKLKALAEHHDWADLVRRDAAAIHDAFELTFEHAKFTGRSGRMHKYEGLGSVYWHMVSKLLVATQECVFEVGDRGADPDLVARLRDGYLAIRDGLGFHKSPGEFGAVPHEPYSHTPWNAGAQQPGMTGQVKEGVLARFGELGVRVRAGCIEFDPILIDPCELLLESQVMHVYDEPIRHVEVPAGALGFTLCGTPIILSMGDADEICLHLDDGSTTDIEGAILAPEWSRDVFSRTGRIRLIDAKVRRSRWMIDQGL